MSDKKSNLCRIFSLVISISFFFNSFAFAAATPAERLAKGKQLYSQGKYDQAMDNFIDVFVAGNSEQIAEANEYVNMIHFAMGSVEAPKQVAYDPVLEASRKQDQGQGKVMGNDPTAAGPKPTASAAAPAAAAKPIAETKAITVEEDNGPTEQIIVEDSDLDFYTAEQRALRKESTDDDIAAMTDGVLNRLSKVKGLNVYMRGGLIDAIDIPSELIFNSDKTTFSSGSKAILDDVYALMILSGTPSFVLLPPGSYTDDVTIQGVRQVVALNSYLINMGLSTAKLHFNMGLTTEQPPAKFSDLEGISIVFDYTAKPVLKQSAPDKKAAPVLSLGLYPFESFTPANDEGMLIDFSVIQTANPIADWKLQIIQHAKDGKYYVVRQISGKEAVYQQVFWNGKKQYFGQILPLGRYTVILRAQDIDGKEKIVRRKVSLLGAKNTGAVAAKEPKKAAASADSKLDYKSPRLWTKPKRIEKEGAAEVAAVVAPTDDYLYGGDDAFATVPAPASNVAPAVPGQYGSTDPYAMPQQGQYNSVNTPDPLADPYPSQQPADNSGYLPLDDANFDY